MHRSIPLRLIGLLLWVMVLSPVEAAPDGGGVVGGGCTETDLNTALAGGGTVTFACGGPKTIALTGAKTIALDTTIDGGGVITLTGNLATRLFSVNPGVAFTLKNIVLDEANSGTSDGGAISNHGTLVLENSTIRFSRTSILNSGGAIFSDGPVFITGSAFLNNYAGNAGALYAKQASAGVQINNSTFSNNQAIDGVDGFGGAIWIDQQAQLSLDNPYLSNNHARYGGALYISPGAVATITASPLAPSFFQNFAAVAGGAINNQAGGLLTTSGVQLNANSVPTNSVSVGSGGAIFSAGPLSLHNTYFLYNRARYGGGMLIDASGTPTPIILEHDAFGINFAAVSGGGLYASFSGAVVTITATIFDENLADTGGGGGIARHNAHLSIQGSTFLSNRAGVGGGGGLWADASGGSSTGGAVQVLDSTFSTNHLQNLGKGGAIKNTGAQVNLRNVTLAENDGGVFNFGSDEVMTTTNSVFWNAGFLNCEGDGTLPQSQGGNYSSDNSCNFANIGDETNRGNDPLSPRTIETSDEMYGLVYYLPKPGSSLINTARPVCSPRDQRGAMRPDACDKGAVEFGGLLPRAFAPLIRK